MGAGFSIAVSGDIDPELAEATSIEVYESMGQPTSYTIRYETDVSEGDLLLPKDSRLDAGSELSVLVPGEDTTHCLVKGPVQGQKIHLVHGGAGSWMEVNGSDTSIVMDRETKSAVWEDVIDSDVVSSILENYGYTPDVQITSAGHYVDKHALVQRESDLRLVHRLARRNGFLFHITCDESGNETAHFKHPAVDGAAEAKLVINLESPNLESVDIQWDVERPTSIEGKQLDLNSKTDMEIALDKSPLTVLGELGLGDITGDTRSVHLSAPADDDGDMTARGEGALIEANWFIRANCRINLDTLGKPVRSHTIIELKGAGSRHSGNYYVASVRHTIDASAHQMDLELIRSGWGS